LIETPNKLWPIASYAAQETSSRLEVSLRNHNAPEALASAVGELERGLKFANDMQTVWTSETVHLPKLVKLGQLTMSGNLAYYEGSLEGSVYPLAEEVALQRFVGRMGYKPTQARMPFAMLRHTPPPLLAPIPVHNQFGPGSRDTTLQRWSIPHIGRVRPLVEHIVGKDTVDELDAQLTVYPRSVTKGLTIPHTSFTL
jgi:hypothetical protein